MSNDDDQFSNDSDEFERSLEELNLFSEESSEESKEEPSRKRIALDTLARYSGSRIRDFQPFVLLTNFPHYVDRFAEEMGVEACLGSILKVAHCPKSKISIIDYRVGAPMAALVLDVLSYIEPEAAIMLGLCGGLHRHQRMGDYILPIAAIRDEGASLHYMPKQVPSLPAFMVQQLISEELLAQGIPFRTGVLHTTDYRMWEFDEAFRARLKSEKASAIDMECSALFTAGFARKVPVGALMLVSDLPLKPKGIKTKQSAKRVFRKYSVQHLKLGIDSIKRMQAASRTQKLNLRRFHF